MPEPLAILHYMLRSRLLVFSYLHFFHHLLAEGADFSGGCDDHVFRALILARDAVEKTTVILKVQAEVRLNRHKKALIISGTMYTVSALRCNRCTVYTEPGIIQRKVT